MSHEANISKEHYFDRRYLKRERLYSFVEQIELIKSFAAPDDSILEIGLGNAFVNRFLQEYLGYAVKSVDINENLKPDFVDNIIEPKLLTEKSFDVATCFEVLEHMPFEQSVQALRNLCRISRKWVIVSVPDMRYFLTGRFTIFGSLPLSLGKLISFPRLRRRDKTFGNDHCWEIGIKIGGVMYSAGFIRKNLFEGMTVVKDYRCQAVPWHHYYVVKI